MTITHGLYGIGRAGFDFILSFVGWLVINEWFLVQEETAVCACWATEDDATIMRRAISLKKYVDRDIANGSNPIPLAAQSTYLKPWEKGPARKVDDLEARLLERKRVAGTSSRCVVMAAYVDDCDMDGTKRMKGLMWQAIRLMSTGTDPEEVQIVVGLVHLVKECGLDEVYVMALSQKQHMENMSEELPEELRSV